MWFTVIFVSLFVAGWMIVASVPWLVISVRTRGEAGLAYLPLSWLAGVVCAVLVPVLGFDDGRGLALSFVVAFLAPALLLAARRFSLGADEGRRAAMRRAGEARQE